jgi:hypothetical protein
VPSIPSVNREWCTHHLINSYCSFVGHCKVENIIDVFRYTHLFPAKLELMIIPDHCFDYMRPQLHVGQGSMALLTKYQVWVS